MTIQKINTKVKGRYELAYKYFFMISTINDLELVKRDVQLLAYSIAENKPVSDVKKDFVKNYNSSMATVGNIISKLYKLNVLKKDKRTITINPAFLFDFSNDLGLGIKFSHVNGD